jgi:hypothetical protein
VTRTGYTAEDLLRAAAEQGTPASKRLLVDWVQRGLIDRPKKVGLGQGKGSVATWPDAQKRLLLGLLKQRRTGARLAATLANWPVWYWLRFGEELVPIRQVRRALKTWGSKYRKASKTATLRSAIPLADQLAHPEASPRIRKAFIDEVVRGSLRGRLDHERFLRVARLLYDPHGTGSRRLLDLRPTPEDVARQIDARLRGIRTLDSLTDDQLRWVRTVYISTRRGYALEQPLTVLDSRIGDFVGPQGLQEEIENACLHVLTIIGLKASSRDRPI